MQFDFEKLSAPACFEFLTGTVVPRPIALITTVSASGQPNAAPYSYICG
jgi:flavin reductase (DIM6/NTAB) family NADH-FMN oxidoreductase RutF